MLSTQTHTVQRSQNNTGEQARQRNPKLQPDSLLVDSDNPNTSNTIHTQKDCFNLFDLQLLEKCPTLHLTQAVLSKVKQEAGCSPTD